jgi:hypothetical protein
VKVKTRLLDEMCIGYGHAEVRGSGGVFPSFLTSALVTGDWSVSVRVPRGRNL